MADPVADELAIRNVLARYCHLSDDGRYEEWGELFTEDCTADLSRGHIQGRAEMVNNPNRPRGRHLIVNAEIDLHGDEADVMSDLIMLQPAEDGPRIIAAARYYDKFVRVGDTWLIKYKRAADHLS